MVRRTREARRFRDELLDELPAGADPAQVSTDGGLLDDLNKAVAERALDAEMDAHLEGERLGGNHRNGHNRKRVLTDEGALDLGACAAENIAAVKRVCTLFGIGLSTVISHFVAFPYTEIHWNKDIFLHES